MLNEGIIYTASTPKISRSKIYDILTDRSYIGEVRFRGFWYPGIHTPIIDRVLWDRVRTLLGQKVYKQHQMTYAANLIECGYCGLPITGERKSKKTRRGERQYTYYRCSRYHKGDHPRIRLTEQQLDSQMLAIFDSLRLDDDEFRHYFQVQLRKMTNLEFAHTCEADADLKKRHTEVVRLQSQLLNLRLLEEIDANTYAVKAQELRDEESELRLRMERCSRDRTEIIDVAVKAFELSQSLREKWVTADYVAKRRILEITCLNCKLVDVTLCVTMKKPFDLLAKGLISKESGARTTVFGIKERPLFQSSLRSL